MTRTDHFGAAERLLDEAAEASAEAAGVLAARAQAHALLALASATAPGIYPTPEMMRRRDATAAADRAREEEARKEEALTTEQRIERARARAAERSVMYRRPPEQ